MSSLRKNPAKIFVKVRADHLLDGSTRPLMLRSEDGPTLRIDRVLDVREAPSLKARTDLHAASFPAYDGVSR